MAQYIDKNIFMFAIDTLYDWGIDEIENMIFINNVKIYHAEKTFLPIDDDDQETWFELPLNVLIWIYRTKKINLRLERGVL